MYTPTDLTSFNDASWGDAPAYHSPWRQFVYPGRRVLVMQGVTWPRTPEECPGADEFGTQWLFEDTILVCRGCGLDST
ncbi:MAG: hypothetical protein WC054_01340 [Candidatus Nanopelagicales bacterium]